ncbi:MAG: hypothetical protein H0W14_10015, partial [Actinobacteria bacterium]|nr:hypothetical protein [Actinomycetota bacterium]
MRIVIRALILCVPLLAPALGRAEVRVVPPFELERYAGRAAIGLLVPGAGPEVTREGALAALLRGKLRHDLLGGAPSGTPLIELGRRGGPLVLVALPPDGRTSNDRRYP